MSDNISNHGDPSQQLLAFHTTHNSSLNPLCFLSK